MIQGKEAFEFVMSEITEVTGILQTIPEDCPIEKMSFESRLEKLKYEIVDVYKRAIVELESLLPIASKKSAINTISTPWTATIRLNYEDVCENIERAKRKMKEFIDEV